MSAIPVTDERLRQIIAENPNAPGLTPWSERWHAETQAMARALLAARAECERLRAALVEIAKPTYGTEPSLSDEELASICWAHVKRFQWLAKEALGAVAGAKGGDDASQR